MRRVLILSLGLVSSGVPARAAADTPRTIRVVMDNDYAPYVFHSNNGKLQGILIDQWQAWEARTGIKAEIHAVDWDEALARMRAGEFDVIDSIVETSERLGYLDFTPPYATVEASIFFRSDVSGITDLASLNGFPVGVKAGDQHVDTLKKYGVTTLIAFQNNAEIIEAAKQHKINVFVVDAPSAVYLLNKAGIEADFRRSAPIFRDELRRAVRKGDAALLRTVSAGFAAIEPRELTRINEEWFGRPINRLGRYLAYAGYATGVSVLLIAALVAWNRMLRRGILQRTAALQKSHGELRALSQRLRTVREEERARIAREMHDEVGQALTALQMDVAWLGKKLPSPAGPPGEALSAKLRSMAELIDTTTGSVQRIATDLRPGVLDELGLPAAIEWWVREFEGRAGIACRIRSDLDGAELDPERATAVFRILQEALTNVARHAGATEVEVHLSSDDKSLVLEIQDNGRGVSEDRIAKGRSLGLLGMRERALSLGGEISIRGETGQGTRVTLTVPR